jgi:hypothetical protein
MRQARARIMFGLSTGAEIGLFSMLSKPVVRLTLSPNKRGTGFSFVQEHSGRRFKLTVQFYFVSS